jgi:ergothioneine biosynthesis protein EgtB
VIDNETANVESPHMRHAGKGLLSLALMDARNHTLRWFGMFEDAQRAGGQAVAASPDFDPPLWTLGHVGWFQERWIARNVERARGPACDPTRPRLASVEANADAWFDTAHIGPAERWLLSLPTPQVVRQTLAETLDTTLELLESADETDDALYFYRLALFHEDMHCEAFACAAQTLGIGAHLLPPPPGGAPRAPLVLPATRHMLGSAAGGFVFDNEKWAHEEAVPEFEIDARPVNWGQYTEFVEDGGYDDSRWWTPAGWDWVQRGGRRCPRHVEQMRHGVLAQRFGSLTRVPLAQPAMHVSWHEADAWCRWAGRRLPTEVEWECAAVAGASMGFAWGQVWEWTASTFRRYPGFAADPWRELSQPAFGTHKVLRGASFATRARMRNARYRNFELPERDDIFCGFRSCAA